MSSKQRDGVFQRWSGLIGREARDLASLEQMGKRALADSDVRSDPALQAMIRAEVQRRRAELEQKRKSPQASTASVETQPTSRSEVPEQVRVEFNRLASALSKSLERGDDAETGAIFRKMRALQEQNPGEIPAVAIAEYEQRVEKLRIHARELTDEVAVLAKQAVAAARKGSEQGVARSMRRLTAIHAAHPILLDDPGLEGVRRDVANAADERRQHERSIQKLLERERAITAEIKTLAAAVRDFHQVACTVADTTEEFREAEATYLRTIQRAKTYDTEWFSGVVLELADLLAEWTVPPLGAEGQIDRFLDSISAGLDSIRAEMHKIEGKPDSDEGDDSGAAVP